jgi:hypothetical protein
VKYLLVCFTGRARGKSMKQTVYPLSALDVGFVGMPPIDFLIRYSTPLDPERVETSLREILPSFPSLSTRLVQLDETGLGIALEGDTPPFRIREPSVDVEREFDLAYASSYLDRVETLPGEPLMKVSVTPLNEGTLLGISISHAVADGVSCYLLFAAWSAALHGRPRLRPSFRRNPISLPSSRRQLPLPAHACERRDFHRRLVKFWLRRTIGRDQLAPLQAEAAADGFRPTTFQALLAKLLKEYGASLAGQHQDCCIRIPVDVRQRIPGLDPLYFGNAFVDARIELSVSALVERPLSWLAERVRNAIAEMQDEQTLRRLLRLTDSGLEPLGIAPGQDYAPERDIVCSSGMISEDLPVDLLDFGTGAPLWMEIITPAAKGFTIAPDAQGLQIKIIGFKT